MTAILKREFASYFTSPLGYVYLAVFYGFSGLFLWMTCLTGSSADMSSVFLLMFFIMVILIPILTMRTMADDKRLRLQTPKPAPYSTGQASSAISSA